MLATHPHCLVPQLKMLQRIPPIQAKFQEILSERGDLTCDVIATRPELVPGAPFDPWCSGVLYDK